MADKGGRPTSSELHQMLDTAYAIRRATTTREVIETMGPLSARARFALVDYTTGTQRLETWTLDQPSES